MWIRTQDRKKLLECKNIQYREKQVYTDSYLKLEADVKQNYKNYMNPYTNCKLEYREINDYLAERTEYIIKFYIYNYNGDDSDLLGTYSTKERCLEVLDEIEAYINGWGIKVNGDALKVFQMPQDTDL